METLTISKSNIKGDVYIPDSKSFLHRMLIAGGFFAKDNITIKLLSEHICDDILATINFLEGVGVKIERNKNELKIQPIKNLKILKDKEVEIHVNESGTTLRFILPIIAMTGMKAQIVCEQSLIDRPIGPLVEALNMAGASIEINKNIIYCGGKISAKVLEIDPSLSSQYVSGLIFAICIDSKKKIKITNKLVSKQYIEMTCNIMKDFGYEIIFEDNIVFAKKVKVPNKSVFVSTGDWSSAAPFFVAAAIAGEIRVHGLDFIYPQADAQILKILQDAGAFVKITDEYIEVKKEKLNAVEVDIEDYPDLGPILVVLMSLSEGKNILKSIDRIKFKESDRKESIISLLINLSVHVEVRSDKLVIYGKDVIDTPLTYQGQDHRMAMAYSIMALVNKSQIKILKPECVKKSYNDYWNDYFKLRVE